MLLSIVTLASTLALSPPAAGEPTWRQIATLDRTVAVASADHVAVSWDDGRTFRRALGGAAQVTALVVGPEGVYATRGARIGFVDPDGHERWSALPARLAFADIQLSASGEGLMAADMDRLFISKDGGRRWRQLSSSWGGGPPGGVQLQADGFVLVLSSDTGECPDETSEVWHPRLGARNAAHTAEIDALSHGWFLGACPTGHDASDPSTCLLHPWRPVHRLSAGWEGSGDHFARLSVAPDHRRAVVGGRLVQLERGQLKSLGRLPTGEVHGWRGTAVVMADASGWWAWDGGRVPLAPARADVEATHVDGRGRVLAFVGAQLLRSAAGQWRQLPVPRP